MPGRGVPKHSGKGIRVDKYGDPIPSDFSLDSDSSEGSESYEVTPIARKQRNQPPKASQTKPPRQDPARPGQGQGQGQGEK
mmetsp:Transcript_3731/g.7236  ORF Transcript_3731/g.7236 Transcript_3731/m.7236 type:complete len:81 (-) Transcript_3731:318-560(-)